MSWVLRLLMKHPVMKKLMAVITFQYTSLVEDASLLTNVSVICIDTCIGFYCSVKV